MKSFNTNTQITKAMSKKLQRAQEWPLWNTGQKTLERNTNKIRKKEVYIKKIIDMECRKRRCDICIIRILKGRSEQ